MFQRTTFLFAHIALLISPAALLTSLLALLILPAALLFCSAPVLAQTNTLPDTPITKPMTLKKGEYVCKANGIEVTGHDFTLDLQGVRLAGANTRTGIGIHITGAKNVTIKNAEVGLFLWGIVVDKSEGIKLLNCKATFNGDLPLKTVIDESGTQPEDQWGGGILLHDSRDCRVTNAFARYQWDGIDVVRSDGNVIEQSDFSYNGNWGVHFWNSSKNIFRNNRAVWCTTGAGRFYQALTGWQTYDAAAVAIDHASCDNTIEANDLRFGGDGIFIRANEGPLTPDAIVPPKNASNRNVLKFNDCSSSPNNAIEADFVDDTVMEGNNCSDSHYGMWLGYSRRSIVKGNFFINDREKAIEIENGQDAAITNNVFLYNPPRPYGEFVYLWQNGRDKTPSQGYVVHDNVFDGAKWTVLTKDTGISLGKNTTISVEDHALMTDYETLKKKKNRTKQEEARLGDMELRMIGMPHPMLLLPPPAQDVPAAFNQKNAPKITLVMQKNMRSGADLLIKGVNLKGGRVLINGYTADILLDTPTRLEVRLPGFGRTVNKANVLWERGDWYNYERLLPFELTIK